MSEVILTIDMILDLLSRFTGDFLPHEDAKNQEGFEGNITVFPKDLIMQLRLGGKV
ncbi:MAG: hypothetical protein QXO15_05535 [Nitrososphaerota archaeon]